MKGGGVIADPLGANSNLWYRLKSVFPAETALEGEYQIVLYIESRD